MTTRIDFIKTTLKKDGITDSYPKTLATLTRTRNKLKTTAAVGDLILLVTKKGFENTASHVGCVKETSKENVTFELNLRGNVRTFTLPLKALYSRQGFAIVGFYTLK